MNWSSLADFADMGGYALYVWGSYAMVAGAIGWELVLLAHRRRRAIEELRADAAFEPDDGGGTDGPEHAPDPAIERSREGVREAA